MLCMFIGTIVGGYIPTLWNADMLSMASLLFSACGGFLGIWIGYRIGE